MLKQHEHQSYGYQDSEINIIEIWSLLVKRKKVILSIFVLSLLITTCYLFLKKPIYESQSVLRIGQVGQTEETGQTKQADLLEEPYILMSRFIQKYKVNDMSEGSTKLPKLTSISIFKNNNKETSIITLKAQGYSAKEAKHFLTKVTDELLKEHTLLYNDMMSKRFQTLTSLKQELQKIDSKFDLYDKQISSFTGRDDSLIALLVQQKLGLEEQRTSLERQINDLEMYLDKPFTLPTSLLRQPTLPVRAVNFRPVFSMGLAVMLGLMLGVFLVVFLDYWERQKELQGQVNKISDEEMHLIDKI